MAASSFYGGRKRTVHCRRSADQMDLSTAISSITGFDDFELSDECANEDDDPQSRPNASEDCADDFQFPSQHSSMYTFPMSEPPEQTTMTPHAAAATSSMLSGHSNVRTPSLSGSNSNSASVTPNSGYSVAQFDAANTSSTPNQAYVPVRYRVTDLLERQNRLILDLLDKHENLSSSIQEVKSDLKETRATVKKIIEANEKKSEQSEKMKRKYPSSLTVIL